MRGQTYVGNRERFKRDLKVKELELRGEVFKKEGGPQVKRLLLRILVPKFGPHKLLGQWFLWGRL